MGHPVFTSTMESGCIFFYPSCILIRVSVRCISWLISYAWGKSSCDEPEASEEFKIKNLDHSGLALTTLGFGSHNRNH